MLYLISRFSMEIKIFKEIKFKIKHKHLNKLKDKINKLTKQII